MKTILVTKYGMIFRRETIAVGEQGETEAVMRHLVGRGDVRVVYFGQWRGDTIEGVTIEQSHIEDMDDLATAAQQREGFARDAAVLGEYDVCGFIMSCGYAPTASMIDNATGSSVQSAAVRMCAPALNAVSVLGAPRVLINSDPRSYPRDAEITDLGGSVRPVALLDQHTWQGPVGIRGRRYMRRGVYAGVEHWPEIERVEQTCSIPSAVVAHAHAHDGMRSGDSLEAAWTEVLRGCDGPVYGRGWDLTSLRGDRFRGVITPREALGVLSNATSGPILNHTPGFATLKMKTYVSQGCVPLLWSAGPHSYDPYHRYVPRRGWLRFHSEEELRAKTKELEDNDTLRDGLLEELTEILRPNFTMLDEVVDLLVAGDDISWHAFGGYKKL